MKDKEVRVNLDGGSVWLEDAITKKVIEWEECFGGVKDELLAVAEKNVEYKKYILENLDALTKMVDECLKTCAEEQASAELEGLLAVMYQGGGFGEDTADKRAWERINKLRDFLGE